jgi:hypothetical protein
VKNPEGDIVIDESSTNEAPPSTLNFEICESTASNVVLLEQPLNPISLFPNPVVEAAQIQGLTDLDTWLASIHSAEGRMVAEQRGHGSESLDLTDLPAGLYTLQLRVATKGTKALRFVKR